MAMTQFRRLVPIPDARHVLGDIGRTTLYELVNGGEIVKVNIGRRGFITSESLDAYMDRLTRHRWARRGPVVTSLIKTPDEDLAEADRLEARANQTGNPKKPPTSSTL